MLQNTVVEHICIQATAGNVFWFLCYKTWVMFLSLARLLI